MSAENIKSLEDGIQAVAHEFREELTATKSHLETRTAESEAKLDKMNEVLADLETKLARTKFDGATVLENDEQKEAFGHFIRKGFIAPEHAKAMSHLTDGAGGALVPEEFVKEIVRYASKTNPLLDIVRVTESTTGEITIPRRTALLAMAWAAEAGAISSVDNTYDQLAIKAHKAVVLTKTSQELLDDAAFNVEAELAQDAGEAFGTGVGKAYIDGAGDASNQPSGLLDGTVGLSNTVNSGHATQVTYAGLVDLTVAIKQAYLSNARFLMNVGTLGAIRKLVDSTGQPIWTAMAGSNAANILGYEYTIAEDMPAVAASAKAIVFGDFQSGYRAVRRKEISVKRLNELYAGNDQVGHLFTARFGGKVQDQNALRTQTISA